MPTYDYVCQDCAHRLEIFQPMTESPKKKCPKCKKSKLQRQIGSGAAILFKGSGFYQTDYRSSSYTEGAKKDSGGESTKPAESGKSDSAKTAPSEKSPKSDSKKSD